MIRFLFSLLFLSSVYSYAQRHEITLGHRLGLATSQFKKLDFDDPDFVKHARPQAVHDIGFGIDYKYQVWKKGGVFLGAGIYFSKAQYTFLLYGLFQRGAAIEQVIINKNRFDFQPIRLSKQFNLYQGNLVIEVGMNMLYRHFHKRDDRYLQDTFLTTKTASGTSDIRYRYEINVNYGRYVFNKSYKEEYNMNLNWAYSLTSKYRLRDNMFLNIGFLYQRNYYFAYDYSYDLELKFHDGSTGILKESSNYTKYMIKDDFLNATVGLSYTFGNK